MVNRSAVVFIQKNRFIIMISTDKYMMIAPIIKMITPVLF